MLCARLSGIPEIDLFLKGRMKIRSNLLPEQELQWSPTDELKSQMPKPFQSTARTESWNGLLLKMGGSKLMLMRQSMSQKKAGLGAVI